MSQVCKKHQEKPAKIYGKCIGCEIEWLNQRIREQEELLKFYRERKSETQAIERFLSRLRIMSGTGNGIGVSTVAKIWQFAIREGFLEPPEKGDTP